MRMPDPRTLRLSYLLPCHVRHAAAIVSRLSGVPVSWQSLEVLWQEQLEICAPLRELGERPPGGFTPSDKVKLVERLIDPEAKRETGV